MKNHDALLSKEYMTLADCARKWKLTSEKIGQLCGEGKIAGASKLSGAWIIPIDAEKPIIKNPTKSTLSKTVIPKNRLQEMALMHIENGEPFDVHELTIEGKTFIVSSVFQRQGPTLDELLASLMMRDVERQTRGHYSVETVEKIRSEVRRNSSAAKATFDDYIYTYRERLKRYGFSDGDIEILLEKIAADYEPFIV